MSLIKEQVPFRVLLPERFWKEARDRDHFKQLLADYMRIGYPNYVVKSIKEGFAICERRESNEIR
jgi:hypothetical protein